MKICKKCGELAKPNNYLAGYYCINCGNLGYDDVYSGLKPLGLIPRQKHDYQRIQDIKETMIRYINANMDIPTEWLEEWGELMRKYPNADFQLFE